MAGRRRSNGFNERDVSNAVGAFSRLDRRVQLGLVALLAITGIGYALWHFSKPKLVEVPPSSRPMILSVDPADHLLLGNPSDATPDGSNRDNYLMLKPYFATSYNNSRGGPNWVSWRTNAADFGDTPRKLEFDTDSTLPKGFVRIAHRDFSNSGFDRGHMCPNGDRGASKESANATFVMTNIIPQAPNQNQKAWRMLEEYSRDLVQKRRMRTYTVAGGWGRGGTGDKGFAETVGNGKVVVPSDCWKVIVAVPEMGEKGDVSDFTPSTRVIAVWMPNDQNAMTGEDWSPYRVSPAEIEKRTGYKFFTALPAETAEALRNKVDQERIVIDEAKKSTRRKDPEE